ncbi:MAG: hypothetical protein RIB71_20490 [Imperialibacter sp.]|uniref:hypothetical protein n=1 Tax=Imperialibacter sp. TaxID=2038411 RepID=UPI0032EE8105
MTKVNREQTATDAKRFLHDGGDPLAPIRGARFGLPSASSRAGFRSSDPFTPPFLTFHNFLFYVSKNFPNIVPIMKLVKDIVTTRLRDIDPTKA